MKNKNVRLQGLLLLGVLLFSAAVYADSSACPEGSVYVRGDFEDGNNDSWNLRAAACCDHSINIVETVSRTGSSSIRSELRCDDPILQNGLRSEIFPTAPGVYVVRDPMPSERWYGFSIYLPEDFSTTAEDYGWHLNVAQWHGSPDQDLHERSRSPPLTLVFNKKYSDQPVWQVRWRWDAKQNSTDSGQGDGRLLDSIEDDLGIWTDWVFHVRWSYEEDGFLQVWKNGELVIDETGPIGFNDERGPYFKTGIYRGESTYCPIVSYVDALTFADERGSYGCVAPEARGGNSSTPPSTCQGDTNGDGLIDIIDLNFVSAEYGKTTGFDPAADVNDDGTVDILDVNIVSAAYGTGCDDEPQTMTLMDGFAGWESIDIIPASVYDPDGGVVATCSDGIKNQHEEDVDCGGECISCYDWPPATHFIDPVNGDDDLSGTSREEAWRTIYRSNRHNHQPGDIIEFIGDATITTWNEYIHPMNSGTKDNPITYRSERGHRTTLANNNYRGHTLLLNPDSYDDDTPRDYIHFRNFRIVNKYWGRIDGTVGVHLEDLECMHYDEINPSIEEVRYDDPDDAPDDFISYWGVWGFRMQGTDYSVIRNNQFYGSQIGSSQDILQISGTAHHNLIENNMFHDTGHVLISLHGNNDGKGKIEPLENDARFNVIRNNYFWNEYHSGPISNVGGYFVLYDGNFAERLGTGTLAGENYKYSEAGNFGNEFGGFSYGSGTHGILRNNIISRSGSSQWPTGYELRRNKTDTWWSFGSIGSSTSWGDVGGDFEGNIGTSENTHIFNNVFYKNWGTVFSPGNGLSSTPMEGSDIPLYKDHVYKNNIFYKNGEPGENFPGTDYSKNRHEDMFITYHNSYYEYGGLDWQKEQWNDKWLNNLMEDTDNEKILLYGSYKYDGYRTLPELEAGVPELPGTTFAENIQGNPQFKNPDGEYDAFNLNNVRDQFSLTPGSAAIDTGAFLTRTTSSGSGTVVPVEDPYYFAGGSNPDNWDSIIEGDVIQVGDEVVQIESIDYDAKRLTVDRSISWTSGEGISFPYEGDMPDMGVQEYSVSSGSGGYGGAVPPASTTDYLPSFPGAEGFGAVTRGAYALYEQTGNPDDLPVVYRITSLSGGSSPGMLGHALRAAGPRIVVFDVGGTIELGSDIPIKNPYITIAGQTAPGEGISIIGAGIRVNADEAIVRGLRIRPGDRASNPNPQNRDALGLAVATPGILRNVIIDHNSLSWGIDETASMVGRFINVTWQNNIVSEGLDFNLHPEGKHSKGLLLGYYYVDGLSTHHNVFAKNWDRNPLLAAGSDREHHHVEMVNNLLYYVHSSVQSYADSHVIGNVLLDTKTYSEYQAQFSSSYQGIADYAVYMKDNFGPKRTSSHQDEWDGVLKNSVQPIHASAPLFDSTVTVTEPGDLLSHALAHAGATIPMRDAVDTRLFEEMIAGRGTFVDCVGSEDLVYPEGNVLSATSNTATLAIPYFSEAGSDGREDAGYTDKKIKITSGPGAGQTKNVLSSVFDCDHAADVCTNTVTISGSWSTQPTSTSEYAILTDCSNNAGGWDQAILPTTHGPPDTDEDGMPDWWEQQEFGCATCGEVHGDTDTDGYYNIEEYINHFYEVGS